MSKKYTLECCVDCVESAITAMNGGANRLELCSALSVGGVTPSVGLFRKVKECTNLPINVLIRPRGGDFLYSDYEIDVICQDAEFFCYEGANGIVTGCLNKNGSLDADSMKKIISRSNAKNVTLHRAFDVCCDPFETIDKAISLGINTILTSGQKNLCINGMQLLKELINYSKDKIDILIGSGVNHDVIKKIIDVMPAKHFHMSAKHAYQSQMVFRNPNVNMGDANQDEYTIWKCDIDKIKKACETLESMK